MPTKISKKRDAYGYSEMEWAEQLDPEYAALRAELRRMAIGEGALPVKVKEMVVIGILAARGLQYGVTAHMRNAVSHGATFDELFEAIKAAHVAGGGMAYSVGIRALQELEQDGVFKQTRPAQPSRSRSKAKR